MKNGKSAFAYKSSLFAFVSCRLINSRPDDRVCVCERR